MTALMIDLGGVLFDVSFQRALFSWADASGVTEADLKRRFQFDAAFNAFEVQRVSPAVYFVELQRKLGIEIDEESLVRGWNAIFGPVKWDVVCALYRAREAGLRVVGVTNTNVVHELFWRARYCQCLNAFDAIYTSTFLRCRKPEGEFFAEILRQESLDVDEVAFFDDLEENVVGAESIGFGRGCHLISEHGELVEFVNTELSSY